MAWRFPLAFQVFFSLILCCLCPLLPDSPRLLLRKEKHHEALEVLAALEGDGATAESPSIRAQYQVIYTVLQSENMKSYTWAQLLSGKGMFVWAFLLLCCAKVRRFANDMSFV